MIYTHFFAQKTQNISFMTVVILEFFAEIGAESFSLLSLEMHS